MAFTYFGDRTATQAPSSPPVAGVAPELELPSDGDAVVVASVNQEFKTLADYIAFERAPFANASAWTQALKVFQSACLQSRWGVDHFGFPGGRLIQWTETWANSTGAFGLSGAQTGTTAGRWLVYSNDAAFVSGSQNPEQFSAWNNSYRFLNIALPYSGAGAFASYKLGFGETTAVFSDDLSLSVDFDMALNGVDLNNLVIGLTCNGEEVNAIADGVFFIKGAADTNWQCRTIIGGVNSNVDSGVAALGDVLHNFRIVLQGANVADDTARHALFFIDNAKVADIGSHLPVSGGGGLLLQPIFGGTATAGGGTHKTMYVGNVGWKQNTHAGDVFP